ncbi:hypothetical protein BJ508DRAFT_333790 [Ascobolus immersus RN42]|uniref:Uncharacterized protein n=1 Tax=Ascobolus immersus RN42 TaxID=1160509 RepID=A0A3N4HPK6_ASCIM|nr:hypothetical protein BJ508DRAFT_333790 [Ascobolus immersus RN42]
MTLLEHNQRPTIFANPPPRVATRRPPVVTADADEELPDYTPRAENGSTQVEVETAPVIDPPPDYAPRQPSPAARPQAPSRTERTRIRTAPRHTPYTSHHARHWHRTRVLPSGPTDPAPVSDSPLIPPPLSTPAVPVNSPYSTRYRPAPRPVSPTPASAVARQQIAAEAERTLPVRVREPRPVHIQSIATQRLYLPNPDGPTEPTQQDHTTHSLFDNIAYPGPPPGPGPAWDSRPDEERYNAIPSGPLIPPMPPAPEPDSEEEEGEIYIRHVDTPVEQAAPAAPAPRTFSDRTTTERRRRAPTYREVINLAGRNRCMPAAPVERGRQRTMEAPTGRRHVSPVGSIEGGGFVDRATDARDPDSPAAPAAPEVPAITAPETSLDPDRRSALDNLWRPPTTSASTPTTPPPARTPYDVTASLVPPRAPSILNPLLPYTEPTYREVLHLAHPDPPAYNQATSTAPHQYRPNTYPPPADASKPQYPPYPHPGHDELMQNEYKILSLTPAEKRLRRKENCECCCGCFLVLLFLGFVGTMIWLCVSFSQSSSSGQTSGRPIGSGSGYNYTYSYTVPGIVMLQNFTIVSTPQSWDALQDDCIINSTKGLYQVGVPEVVREEIGRRAGLENVAKGVGEWKGRMRCTLWNGGDDVEYTLWGAESVEERCEEVLEGAAWDLRWNGSGRVQMCWVLTEGMLKGEGRGKA